MSEPATSDLPTVDVRIGSTANALQPVSSTWNRRSIRKPIHVVASPHNHVPKRMPIAPLPNRCEPIQISQATIGGWSKYDSAGCCAYVQ